MDDPSVTRPPKMAEKDPSAARTGPNVPPPVGQRAGTLEPGLEETKVDKTRQTTRNGEEN